jgi:hypothetical protein
MFYVSTGDTEALPREMYRRNRIGFGAKRIPRKAKKRLLREWQSWQWSLSNRAPKEWR